MKKGHKHKSLESAKPFGSKHRVIPGEQQTHLKPSKVKRQKKELHVNAITRTGLVKGPLVVKGKGKGHKGKRATTKA